MALLVCIKQSVICLRELLCLSPDAVQLQLADWLGWAAAAQAPACLQAFIPRALLVPEGFGNSYNVNDYFH